MKAKKEIVDLFLEENTKPKYIFGTNKYGIQVAQYISERVVFINEITNKDIFEGYPVIHSLNEVEEDAIVLNCIISSYPITIKNKLDRANITNVDLFSLMRYSNLPIQIEYWKGFKESYAKYKMEYQELFNILADEKSKETLRRLMDVRLNCNIESMSMFHVDGINQYFEPFLNLQVKGEAFVDVGGFDGNTTLQFIKHCPQYDKIFFFEPEPTIMSMAKKKLSGNKNIEYCQIAASNKNQMLHFHSNDSASNISDEGEMEVQADTIDSQINMPVSYIKMDIEGSESLAIEGACQTILKYHPRLAICVYHKGGDFIDIPHQVLAIRDDYKIYLRHYTEGVTETVMFFIPQNIK